MMEQQPPALPQNTSLFQLNLDAANSYTLRSAASWAKVTGVVGMVMGILLAIMMIIAMSQINTRGYGREGFGDLFYASRGAGPGILIFFITAAVFIIGGIFSWTFGNKISIALRANDQYRMNAAFANLRNYYALRAIVLIIVLLLFLISFATTLGR
jgi:hypothetical protein